MHTPRGRYSRGYLPHLDGGEQPQFLTWRLADAVPSTVLEAWMRELERTDEQKRKLELYRRFETFLDAGHGGCTLGNPVAANIVQDTLLRHHCSLYRLHEWVVMPNHVHVLLTPLAGVELSQIVKANKGASSRMIQSALGGSGRLWQPEYFDRLLRDRAHFERVGLYIRRNPVKAKLAQVAEDWPYGSANRHVRRRLDQIEAAGNERVIGVAGARQDTVESQIGTQWSEVGVNTSAD